MDNDVLLLLCALIRTSKAAEAQVEGLVGCTELSAARLLTLHRLNHAEEPISLSQLATHMAFVKSNATVQIDYLEARGLVKRVPDPNDRRITLLEVTDKGREIHDTAVAKLQPMGDSLRSLYTPEEWTQLVSLLKRLDNV